ncbi:hypothetical protein [Kitasatospora sp. NPDC093558]|uniref:hypothetical protein n=1 Tax=Kitasatospora sp. NPDC093558 TaxID=3155201 RepID=UPI0034277F4D
METATLVDLLTRFGATGDFAGLRPLGPFPVPGRGEAEDSGRVVDEIPWPVWFRYGALSVDVCRCGIIGAVAVRTWYDDVVLPVGGPGEYGSFPGPPGFQELSAAFAAAGVRWERRPETHSLPQFSMVTIVDELADVTVDFVFTTMEDPDHPTLYSAHARESSHLCPDGP